MAESQVRSREAKVDFDDDVLEVTAQGPGPGPGPSDEELDFDDDTLKAIAEVHQEEGDKEFTRKEVHNAIYFYTKGIKVNCKDVQLNAKLYSNRATAYYHLGNFHEALNDATAAVKLEPTSIKAIETGASACEQLQCYEDAITWCEKGLAIDKTSKTFLDLRARCVGERIKLQEAKSNPETNSVKGQKSTESLPKTTKDVGDNTEEETWYSNVAYAHNTVIDLKDATQYPTLGPDNLGNAYTGLVKQKAIEYHELDLKIAKEVGDRAGEGSSYGNLGNAYDSLGDFKKAIEYHELHLKIAKEVGDRAGEGNSYCNLGNIFESQGSLLKALDCYHSSVRLFNDVRRHLQGKDEWAISYRDINDVAYTGVWRVMLKQGDVVEALFAVEQGRAQALKDLMNSKYETETPQTMEVTTCDTLSCLPSNTVFMAVHEREIIFWIIQNGKDVQLRKKEMSVNNSKDVATTVLESLIDNARKDIGVRSCVKCEDRSLDRKSDGDLSKKKSDQIISLRTHFDTSPLRVWYDVIISPITDLINGNEVIFVPEGPLCLAPYAAFMDSNSNYLSESYRIRIIPSLNSLKLINDCSPDYHKKSGALLVGDPCLEEVRYRGLTLEQLPFAKMEVEMIGKILHTVPLTGKAATKDEVLTRLSSVALVHIAAHGCMETGEIALAPNPTRASQMPGDEDFLLTMSDVMSVQMRARLVVLSCCHSGRGEIKAEGVVGIARAFFGAGARSVLVSLWAIDDEATLEFMKSFYLHLANGKSASESLNRAMKCVRESEKFSEVKYWAPFVLIGDDVTLDLAKGD